MSAMEKQAVLKAAAALTAALAGTAALTLAGSYYAYRVAFRRDEKRTAVPLEVSGDPKYREHRDLMNRNIQKVLAAPCAPMAIRSRDGLRLTGRYYAGKPGAPVFLFFHGYRSVAERDGSGGFQFCRERGYGVLMADQRAHGGSEGKTITFGVRERYDCLDWIKAAILRFGPEVRLVLVGVSMGAATVLSAADLPLPENVKGIWADCGFAAPEDILKDTIRRWRWPMVPTWHLVRLGARLFGGFDVRESSALAAVRHARVPILLIHGEADPIVPHEMAHALKEACASTVTLLSVPGAGHGISYYVDMPAYYRALEDFCQEILP